MERTIACIRLSRQAWVVCDELGLLEKAGFTCRNWKSSWASQSYEPKGLYFEDLPSSFPEHVGNLGEVQGLPKSDVFLVKLTKKG